MSDPRLTVSFNEIGALFASFKGDGTHVNYTAGVEGGCALVGMAVTLSAAGTVDTVGDGEAIIGKLIKVESDDVATVQVRGFCTLPGGSGAGVTLGKKIVGDLGPASAEGYIREVNTASAAELGVARGFITDASTTTAIVVWLD
jgi:hypothetical protein